MNSFARVVTSVIDVGRDLLARRRLPATPDSAGGLGLLCRELLNHRGEASGLALASDIAAAYMALQPEDRLPFFNCLQRDFDVDTREIAEAAGKYCDSPDYEGLAAIARAVEAPRVRLFRRINMAPGGTGALVKMRGHLLECRKANPHLKCVDADLRHLFVSWFNKGFLEMRPITWDTPASILEKIIEYEAVHKISGWDDLRHRLEGDRACYAFFHPVMPDDPLVFVEVAFTSRLPDAIGPLLDMQRSKLSPTEPDTVVFYSISNCHPGLSGVSFGNFLIKQVVEEVRAKHPTIRTFVTLSPVPGFRRWLEKARLSDLVSPEMAEKVKLPVGQVVEAEVRDSLIKLCAHYLLEEKSDGLARDPVARFHLGNGAQLHRLHWAADLSANGKQQSAGIMVNYLYDLDRIEANHDEYFDQGVIAASKSVLRLLGR